MRLFVAIELDGAARAAVAAEQSRLKTVVGGLEGLKWAAPAQMHLTLAFLGEVAETRLGDITNAVAEVVNVAPFTVTLGGLGVFPPAGAPRVVWLGTRAGSSEVVLVRQVMADRLARVGVALDTHSFHPHLTLARWRNARRSDARRLLRADWMGGGRHDTTRDIASLEVDHVTLFHSRPTAQGQTHTPVAQGLLGGHQAPPVL